MDCGGWYDLESKDFKYLCDIIFLSALQPRTRNIITKRYLRHYGQVYVQPFEHESLKRIFNSIMDWYLSGQPQIGAEVQQLKYKIVNATINVYDIVQKELLPTP